MSQTMDQHQELMKEVEDSIIDAEFKVLTESNEETAMTESGLAILFHNWTEQH